MTLLPYSTIEIVGLNEGGFGRTCGIHSSNCGSSVKVGTHLKLIKSTVDIPQVKRVPICSEETHIPKKRGRPKKKDVEYEEVAITETVECMKAFIWVNGVEGCLVGFVSKPFLKIYGNELDGRVVDIVYVGSESQVESDRRRSMVHNGLAIGVILV